MKIIKTYNFTKTSQTAEDLLIEKESLEQRIQMIDGAISQAKALESQEEQLTSQKEQLLTTLDQPAPGSNDSILDFMGTSGGHGFDEV